jgi:RNA polymerase sigma-70 factor (ECF subfamily)
MIDNDTTLYVALSLGDRDALGELYDRHAPILFAIALHITKQRQRAEDMLHDLFLDLVRAAGQRTAIEQPLRWLVLRIFERAR